MQLKSLGEVNTSPTRLRKAGSSKRPPLRDVDNLFNEQVIERGRSRYRTSTPELDERVSVERRSYTPLEFPSSSTSRDASHHRSSPLSFSHRRSLSSSSPSPPPAGSNSCKRIRSRSPSNAPPRKLPEQPNRRQPPTAEHHGISRPGTTAEQPGAAPPLELKPLRWLNNQAPTGRPKAHDYDHDICRLIVKSCHEFSARVCTQEALPDLDTQINWSREIWETACKIVEENYECSDRVIGLASSPF